ncbi:protein FAM228B [Microcaecilia unicolor]|uniref:Protein FAM228B n=1 Tax=Microcaecilia unicolor TaxID=1415580 RepID=A0A6P7XL00_9AMPH|nr:protein FAM228B [Microcaecilia unicolor]
MTSVLRGSSGKGNITMRWSQDRIEQFIQEDLPVPAYSQFQAEYTRKAARETLSSAVSRKAGSPHPELKSVSASFLKTKPSKEWLINKPLTALEELEDEEGKEFNRATQTVLDTENYFVKEFDKYLMHQEFVELRKKEIKYRKWSQRVSEPLLQAIEDFIDSRPRKEMERRRQLQLAHYLNYCNKKGHVFLEVYDPLEYDPFFLYSFYSPHYKVSTPYLNDPLLREIHENINEERIALQCLQGKIHSNKEMNELHKPKLPVVPLGRQGTSRTERRRAPSDFIESDPRQRSRRRVRGLSTNGIVDFKTWTETKHTPEQVSKEMQICHKRKFLARSLHHSPVSNQVVSFAVT